MREAYDLSMISDIPKGSSISWRIREIGRVLPQPDPLPTLQREALF
jgi:hypothetical protein